jgi:hypothetical protein
MDKVANVAGAIVTLAAITVVVRSKHAADVIRALGNAFAGSINAASGQKGRH